MAKKRGNGEGTINLLADGYWEARLMIGYNEKGKPKYKTFYAKKRSAVAKKLNDYIANQKGMEAESISSDTVEQWLQKWLAEYVASNVKTSTRVSYEGIVRNQLIPFIGRIKLNELKKIDIEKMYNELLVNGRKDRNGGLNVKTVNNVAVCLHKALQVALELEYINKNPASISKVPTLKSTNSRKTKIEVLTKQEQRDLMAVCGDSVYGMATITALYTGVRLGELLAIKWSDIDFGKRTISISKQVNRLHDYSENAPAKTRLGIQNSTKTQSSTRVISISDDLLEYLLQYMEYQQEHIKKWSNAYRNLDMVFAREDGHYIDPVTFRSKFIKLLTKAGLKSYKFHALRHTFATRALEAEIPVKVVSKILGHATVQITMDTYQHVLPELQDEAMNKISAYMRTKKLHLKDKR